MAPYAKEMIMAHSVPVSANKASVADAWPAASYFPSPLDQFGRMFDLFNQSWRGSAGSADSMIKMDCAETQDGLELTAEMPGLKEKDVNVTVSDGVLTVSGEKRAETKQNDKGYRFVERSYGAFSRSIVLPPGTDSSKIKATISDGVLKVVAPRTAQAEPHRIEVKPAA